MKLYKRKPLVWKHGAATFPFGVFYLSPSRRKLTCETDFSIEDIPLSRATLEATKAAAEAHLDELLSDLFEVVEPEESAILTGEFVGLSLEYETDPETGNQKLKNVTLTPKSPDLTQPR